MDIEQLQFLAPAQARKVAERWGTPTYVYSETVLREQAAKALAFSAPFGLTVRYAMKANPNRHILALFKEVGLAIDASSSFEAWRAMRAGFAGHQISVATQELPPDFAKLAKAGVSFNVSSLSQLERWGKALPGTSVGVRINPGIGSGHSAHVSVGGETASFGIWHEYIKQALAIAQKYSITIDRVHVHIGSGTDPASWEQAMQVILQKVTNFRDAATLDLGGGFSVAYMQGDSSTDITQVGRRVTKALRDFAAATGRKLHLEIEPGRFLTAGAGSLVTTINDIVDTGSNGYTFLKIDAGMNDILRPAIYGAQHPLVVVGSNTGTKPYVVTGHCCQSSDMLTPALYKPGDIEPRLMQHAEVGDLLVVEMAGAYCAAENTHGYNSFPASPEVMLRADGTFAELRRRETLDDLLAVEYELSNA